MDLFSFITNLTGRFSDFIQQGGWVLWLVFCTSLLLWLCIFERLWFFRFEYPSLRKNTLTLWTQRGDKTSWFASITRQLLVSEVGMRLNARVKFIHTLIIICPLMGLLGTVTGMVNLFDLIALNGNSDVKAMSAGIYKAILPTLAGLLVGLSGYYFALRLGQRAERSLQSLSDHLVLGNLEQANADQNNADQASADQKPTDKHQKINPSGALPE